MRCMSSSSNSRYAMRRRTFWFRNPAHEESAFSHEQKRNAHEEITFSHEQKRNAHEEITFAHEEKQNAREEIAFTHEADPIDAVMARRFGAPSRCAKLHSR